MDFVSEVCPLCKGRCIDENCKPCSVCGGTGRIIIRFLPLNISIR